MRESIRTGLSPAASAALKGIETALEEINKLPEQDQAAILKEPTLQHLLSQLVEAANRVSLATGKKMNSVLSAEVAASNTVSKAEHGFKLVPLADGQPGIEATIIRPDGNQVTIQLCEGARGQGQAGLEQYGKNNLKGAPLISREDFVAVVDSLLKAIKGFTVPDGALQTEEKALKKAYQIVTEGVWRDGGFSWAEFDEFDDKGGVSGRRVFGFSVHSWQAHARAYRLCCAAFVSPPAESK